MQEGAGHEHKQKKNIFAKDGAGHIKGVGHKHKQKKKMFAPHCY